MTTRLKETIEAIESFSAGEKVRKDGKTPWARELHSEITSDAASPKDLWMREGTATVGSARAMSTAYEVNSGSTTLEGRTDNHN